MKKKEEKAVLDSLKCRFFLYCLLITLEVALPFRQTVNVNYQHTQHKKRYKTTIDTFIVC